MTSSTTTITTLSDITERYTTLRLQVGDEGRTQLTAPIEYQGAFEQYKHHELTSAIGREYSSDFQLRDLLNADDATLRDFARIGRQLSSEGWSMLNCED